MLTSLTKGGGGVSQLLTIADKGGRGGPEPPNMADIICEQSLTNGDPVGLVLCGWWDTNIWHRILFPTFSFPFIITTIAKCRYIWIVCVK